MRWLLVMYVLLDVGAVAVWRSEVTLWGHAYRLAPQSVRTSSNYAKALFAVHRDAEARAAIRP